MMFSPYLDAISQDIIFFSNIALVISNLVKINSICEVLSRSVLEDEYVVHS